LNQEGLTLSDIRGRRALVTGAGHGLGRAIARHLAAVGAQVVVTDRDPARAADVGLELGGTGYPLDVADPIAVLAARERIHADGGPVQIVVNNAGVVFGGGFLDVPVERHRATVEVNLTGLLNVTHAFLPDLVAAPAGHLVNIASASAIVPLPNATSYAATKAAVLAFGESLREELRLTGRRHVRVTAICPSFAATGLFAGAKPARLTWLLDPDAVARATIRAIERNRETVLLPWTVRLLYSLAGGLPAPVYRRLCRALGVSTSMLEWRGHPG
jgi:short-subunit dehydrogenase